MKTTPQPKKTQELEGILQNFLRTSYNFDPQAPLEAKRICSLIQEGVELITPELRDNLFLAALKMAHELGLSSRAIGVLSFLIQKSGPDFELLCHLSSLLQDTGRYEEAIKAATICEQMAKTIEDKIFASHTLIRGLMLNGVVDEGLRNILRRHQGLLNEFLNHKNKISRIDAVRIMSSLFWFSYGWDLKTADKLLANATAAKVEELTIGNKNKDRRLLSTSVKKRIRVGFLSHCLKRHSVGYLARWLIKYLDRSEFSPHIYSVRGKEDELSRWYMQQCPFRNFGGDAEEIAWSIYEDSIDVLVDLDSLTMDISSEVMLMHPAPVQATWLGWDSSGLADYFIADEWTVPIGAESKYRETVLRLPHTQVAIDGFEVAPPTITRKKLGIPDDVVVYLCCQRGFKLNEEIIRAQVAILSEVKNSVLVVKSLGNSSRTRLFYELECYQQGVTASRIIFTDMTATEMEHRANLAIADIVLDTYPYSGATTTIECLWIGLPIVTLVGEQYASRCSFSAIKNTYGRETHWCVAGNIDQYVNLGVSMGKNNTLRQAIRQKLWDRRGTSPLWDSQRFAVDFGKIIKAIA